MSKHVKYPVEIANEMSASRATGVASCEMARELAAARFNVFTHFEKEEDIGNLSSKLEEDLLRIRKIIEQSNSNSILIMNESFVSTTVEDALYLSKQVMQQVIQRDMLSVTVTFLDELASLGETTVSMASVVDPENPARRTSKIIRRPAVGLAYAVAIARKYHLTYENIMRRITL